MEVDHLLTRVENIAKCATMMTETSVELEILAFPYDTLPNESLHDLMYENMQLLDSPIFNQEEQEFAEQLVNSTGVKANNGKGLFGSNVNELLPTDFQYNKQLNGRSIDGSTDMGDVSWITPVGSIITTCAPVGVPLHT